MKKSLELERYGYNITRQSMAQCSEAALRNCFLGAYGFKDKEAAEKAAIEVLKTYNSPVDVILYAEIYKADTSGNEDLSIRQPLELMEIVVYDAGNRYQRAAYFNDKLFPDRYLKALEDSSVQILTEAGLKSFEPKVCIEL